MNHMNLYSYREIVENSQDAIVLTNADGVIQIWNLGANKMFGYSPEEAVGQTLDIIIPDRFRDSHWDGFNNTMATGHSKYEEDMLSSGGRGCMGELAPRSTRCSS